jgi:hypothetical protein
VHFGHLGHSGGESWSGESQTLLLLWLLRQRARGQAVLIHNSFKNTKLGTSTASAALAFQILQIDVLSLLVASKAFRLPPETWRDASCSSASHRRQQKHHDASLAATHLSPMQPRLPAAPLMLKFVPDPQKMKSNGEKKARVGGLRI